MKIWSIIVLVIFLSCRATKEINKPTDREELSSARELLEERRYSKAIERLNNIIYRHPGSGFLEDAQYWLARVYFEKGDYEQAEREYRFLLRNFPTSRFAIKAEYELALTYLAQSLPYYLDQTLTKKALKALKAFIQRHPETELAKEAEKKRIECIDKLARKELETAKLYIKIGRPDAAILFLQGIKERYPETTLLPEIEQIKKETKAIPNQY